MLMNVPWYKLYFTEEYWAFADIEYTTERTTKEALYLQEVLNEKAPGHRIVDLGCGTGRHAIELAQAGFDVIGLDMSGQTIERAKQRGALANVDVQWNIVELLVDNQWPLEEVDAAICIQSFGWGSDSDQLRFLRRIRRHLAPNGVLILDHSNPLWIIRNFLETDSAVIGDTTYNFQRTYDPISSRNMGKIVVSSPGKKDRELPHDIRLYSTAELVSLVREAGYVIDRIDADFIAHCEVTMETRYVQIIAQPLPVPPASLAVTSYSNRPKHQLNLSWSTDETEWLNPSPREIWKTLLMQEPYQGAEAARYYAVNDPYGANRAADVVAAHFGCPIYPQLLTFDAGITSLLHHLCGLADRGRVLTSWSAHPDLSAWAVSNGCEVRIFGENIKSDQLVDEIERCRPALVHLERPTITGELIVLEDLEKVSKAASRIGALVLVDEAYFSYLEPMGSAIQLVHRLDNLVVLRSLSKAYSWGGLRVGFAVASKNIAGYVRELVAPLQVSELAYHMALKLLEAGDIFNPLRSRVGKIKPSMITLLESVGFQVIGQHPELPWVILRNTDGQASEMLNHCGILGKHPVTSPVLHAESIDLLRLWVPLSEERVDLFWKLLKHTL
jgi:histidinol-phosphate/aromatic aminotransferase/cobyric acid decarboxylase-like protein/SAM-dependent methyltransferase